MSRLHGLLFALAVLPGFGASASSLGVSIGEVRAAAWVARDVQLDLAAPDELRLSVASVTLAGQAPLRAFRLRCQPLQTAQGLHCDRAPFEAQVPGWGKTQGQLRVHYDHAQRWQAELQIPARKLQLSIDQNGSTFDAALKLKGFDFSEASGQYAAEKLALDARLRQRGPRWQLDLAAADGQAYVDPVFLDFAAQPLRASATLLPLADGWQVERAQILHGAAGSLEASGSLGSDYRPRQLDVHVDAQDLAAMMSAYVQPFLIGSRLDGLGARGRTQAHMVVRDGALQALTATLDNVDIDAGRLGLAIRSLGGQLEWPGSTGSASTLRWRGGALQRIPLGPSELRFRAQARGLELLQPWRQPLLNGALNVTRLALSRLGEPQMTADFEATIEPIDLPALCKALGWPTFAGTLGGRLPGLHIRDDVWTIDGALEANVFDGTFRIDQLRAIQPFGTLPRVMADIQMRRLDLERLTSAFSFGRITGRLDGDISGLRLLDWRPVAFDGRIYSTPGDGTRRRISQRAIDSISSIGGGPTGVLARGFLRFFDDFAYDRLGLGCVLRDGICAMSGVEPAASKTDQKAYTIVKGRLLPRIDVVGYAQQVSWPTLVEQLKAAQASGGPQLGQQPK